MTFSLTALIAAYNEEDVVGQVAADLAAQGIRIYLIDHGSTDGTVKEVERAAGAALVGVERLDGEAFSLRAILERKAALARELDSSWFVNQDADELRESPWADCSFFEGVRRVDERGYNAIDFEVLNFWPTHDRFRKGDDLRSAFTLCERGGTFDRLQIRCWKRTAGSVDLLSSGGHEAAFEGRRVFPLRFLLRHYPVRTQAQGERKVFQERRPRFDPAERARGWHVQYDALQPGHRFIRDPGELQPYDPQEVRIDLALRHRGVEELETVLDAERGRIARLRADLAARVSEVERLNDDIARRTREKEGLDRDLEGRGRELETLHRDLETRTREKEQLDAFLAARGSEIDALARDLAALAATIPPLRAELEAARRDRDEAREEGRRCQEDVARLSEHVARIERSLTWRVGAPLRSASAWLRGRA